jgi:phosphate acetyltransferase
MNRDIFKELERKAREVNASIVYPEGEDVRVIEAAQRVRDARIATPVLLGDPDKIAEAASAAGADLSAICQLFPAESGKLDAMVEDYCARRATVKPGVALRLMKKPMFFGAMMVHLGEASGMVAGAASATTSVLQAAGLAIGYASGVPCPSSIMLMRIPDFLGQGEKFMAFADPAVTVEPTDEELAAMAVQSGMNFRRFTGETPRVALLSFSTKGSAAHARVHKVRRAVDIAQTLGADFPVDGEFQADAAIVPRVAEKKVKVASEVAGRANVLVFPDLDSANCAYKLTQYLAGADAIGPVLQGFRKPVNDLSRGATADDIVRVTILTVLQALS